MEEKLYTIPVKEAFEKDCECPLCYMYDEIEKATVEFTMGPSYMEDYIRFETDEKGFCKSHIKKLYEFNNRLGLAIMLETHLKKINQDVKNNARVSNKSGFLKKKDYITFTNYLDKINSSCFVCDRVNSTFERYIATIFHLWKNDIKFAEMYRNSKGFCVEHFNYIIKSAQKELSGKNLDEYVDITTRVYLKNMERILEDVEWFEKKFDYRFKNEPWKNSKDALPRALNKLNGVINIEE